MKQKIERRNAKYMTILGDFNTHLLVIDRKRDKMSKNIEDLTTLLNNLT